MPNSAQIVKVERTPLGQRVEPFGVRGYVVVKVVACDGDFVQRYQSVKGFRSQSKVQDIRERK